MILTIIRHGESQTNLENKLAGHFDTPLTNKGIKQAEETAKKLKNEIFDCAFSSDLQRAYKTAEILLDYHPKVQLTIEKSLRERNFGKMAGRYKNEIAQELMVKKDGIYEEMSRKGISESDESLMKRAKSFVNSIINKHKEDNVLLINHGGMMRSLLTYILQEDYTKIHHDNCSITKIEIRDTLPGKVIIHNNTDHLS